MLILHHASKGSAGLDWSQQAAGSFAMSAATESQIFISRYPELRKQSLDYEHVLDGGAASAYPLILQLQNAFGKEPFGAKELTHETGVSRATAHRQIECLYRTRLRSAATGSTYLRDETSEIRERVETLAGGRASAILTFPTL